MTTPDTPAHTPLPWRTSLRLHDDSATSIHEDNGRKDVSAIAVCVQMGTRDTPEAEANAAFIVRACNSHYQLVEALRDIIDHFDCSHGNAPGHDHLIPGVWDKDVSNGAKGGTKCGWCEQWNEARAALSQAGGHNAD